MNRREGRGLGRGLLVAIAVLGVFLLFAAASVDRGTPSPVPSPTAAEIADAAPEIGTQGDVAGSPQEPSVDAPSPKAPALPAVEPSELVIFLQPGTDPNAFAQERGLRLRRTLKANPNGHVFVSPNPAAALALHGQARTDPRVARSFLNRRTQHIHCVFVPNDPHFPDNSPAPFHGQWHLGNGASSAHANLAGAWNRDVTGQGVLIGIVDDCLETAHPDLAPNYVSAHSFNFGNMTPDPNPNPAYDGTANEDLHGTSVSGVAAARGGNGVGVTGAAPLAGLAGLRIDFVTQTEDMFYDATVYHSTGAEKSIKVKNHSYGYSVPYIPVPLESSGVTESADAGTIHCFAAGNARGSTAQDSNKTEPQNNSRAIIVAALGSDGKFSSYSSFGANVFVTAPSSGVSGFGIMTTDRVGNRGYNVAGTTDGDSLGDTNYTSTFGGTSSATPLTTGIMALGKQVRPNLDVRFAKHALVRSAVQVDTTDATATGGGNGTTAGSAWKTNAAGFKFNQNYGFGKIDADAFITKLFEIDGVTPGATLNVGTLISPVAVGANVPDNNAAGVTRTFTLNSVEPLEDIQVYLNISHTRRGQLEAFLISPAGTTGRLFYRSSEAGDNIDWTYSTHQFWGENPTGTWTLRVNDNAAGTTGTWNSYAITARTGTIIPNTTSPSVASIVRLNPDPTNAGSVSYLVTFTEPVTGVNAADFALTSTGTLASTSITGVTGAFCEYVVTVNTGTGDGTLRLDVVDDDSIQDSLGNKLGGNGAGNGDFTAGQVYTVDKTPPTVTINQAVGQADPTAGSPILFTVTFSEPVLGFGTGDVTLGGTAGATAAAVAVTGPTTYTVSVSGMTSNGTVIASLAAGVAADAAGNLSLASTSTDNTVTRDVSPPTVTINQAVGQGDPATVPPILFTVTFNEPVTGFVTGDVTLGGTAGATTAIVTGGPSTYTVSVSGMTQPGTVTATIPAGAGADTLGTPSLASTSTDNSVTYTPLVPSVTINQGGLQADPTNVASVVFSVVFSEAVNGFATGDVSFTGSTVGGTLVGTVTGASPGTNFTVTVTGMTSSGTIVVSIPAGRASSAATGVVNAASTSTDNSVYYDNVSPTVTIDQAGGQADPTNGSPILFTVVFSESVTGFTNTDVSFAGSTVGGTLAAVVTGGPANYTVSVSGMTGNGTVVASIPAGVAADSANNPNVASTSSDNTVTRDITAPTVTINQAGGQADPTNGASIVFTATFSENVNNFTNADISFAGSTVGGTLAAAVTGGPAVYTVTVTGMTGSGTVVASIPAGVAVDSANNPNAASTSTDNTVTRDVVAPAVTINQAGGQADPTNGASILFTVTFSETVTGFVTGDVSFAGSTVGGTPVGTVTGSGTDYTVTVTGMTGTGNVVVSVPANRAIDAAGNQNVASTSTDNTVAYDGSAPIVTINQAGGQTDPTNGSPIQFTVVFSENVSGFTTGNVTLGGTAGATTAVVTGGPATYQVAVSGMTGSGTVTASIAAGVATDGVGNTNVASTSTDNTVTYDTTAPTVTINQGAAQSDPTNGPSIVFTATFSETVTGFTNTDVSFAGSTVGGPLAAAVTGGPAVYTVTVTGMAGSGTVVVSIPAAAAADLANNPSAASTSTDNTVTRDVGAPTVTINQGAAQSDPTNGASIVFTVTFSEPVNNFATGDVSFAGSTVCGALVGTVTGAGADYTVTVTGMTGNGTVVTSVPASAATDLAGNPNAASTSSDNTVTRDVTAPTVTIDQAAAQADPSNNSPILFTVVFSENVTGFATGDVTLGGTAGATTAVVTGGPATYQVAVSGMGSSGTVTASLAAGVATDAAGNGNAASTSADNTVTYTTAGPTVTVNQAAGQLDPTNGSPILFTVVFSAPVTGFTTGDVTLGGTAGATTAVVTGAGTTYTVSVSGMTSGGTVTASIGAGVAVDGALNANVASASTDNTVTYDTTAPTVTINQAAAQADPTSGATIQFTVVFSEAVTGFATGDVTLGGTAGATTANVTGGPTTYTVSVTGMTQSGTVTASIAAGVAADPAGTANAASTSADNTVTYDITPPTVTINQAAAQADPTNGSPILFTVVFSEPVSGFVTGDVTLGGTAGATTAIVTGGPSTYTVSVSGMTANGTVTASIAAGVATDAANVANLASTSTDNVVTRDASPPTVTINQAAAQADPINGSPILFTVVFSEPVVGFAGGDVTLGGTAGATTANVTGGPSTYTVSVSGMTGNGTVTASIAAGAATDAAGNASVASTSTDNVVTYDNSAPTVTINQAGGQADPTNGASILFTVVFSEAVTGFATGDVTLGGTAGATTATVTGGPTTYTVTVTGMTTDGTVTASIAAGVATDSAGNGNAASTSTDNTVTRDSTAPTVTVNQAAAQADPTNGSTVLFTAVFSEPVTGFVSADVSVGGTAGGVAAVTGGPTTYTITVSGLSGDGTVTVTIPAGVAADSTGNTNFASTSTDNVVTRDATSPVVSQVTSITANGTYGSGDSLAIAVVFSEPVVVTGLPQLTLETGAADAVVTFTSGSGTATLVFTYTVAAGHVSPDLDVASALALALNGGTIRDPASNDAVLTLAAPGAPGSLGASKDLIVDTTAPLAGTVNDGWSAPDVDTQLSHTTLSANWSGFSDPESGITGYEWAIGTTSGGQQILPFTPVGLQTAASTSAVDLVLSLATGSTFFVTIRATNGAGLTVTATSDGVTVSGPAASGPAAPVGLWAVPDNQAVLLEWLASPSASTSFYRVWWKPAASSWAQAVRVDPLSGLSTIIPALTNGVPYDFMIKAVDASENESSGVFANATPQPSITIGGLGNYGNPQAALDGAVAGETVVLGPGTYPGPLTLPPGVSLQGSSPVHTIITGTITVQGSFPADPTSTIGNLTVTGGTIGVDAGTADVLLDHVIIHHASSHGASSAAGGRLRAVNCTVMSNGGDGLRALGTASVRNCIVGKNLGAGLNVPVGSTVTYDNVYGNGISDYPAGVTGPGNLTAPATFVDEAANKFFEDPLSSTVDTGDPLDVFIKELAPNGGRINQGAFGNTRWAAQKGTAPGTGGGGRRGGGGCGLTGLEAVALLVLLSLRRRRNR